MRPFNAVVQYLSKRRWRNHLPSVDQHVGSRLRALREGSGVCSNKVAAVAGVPVRQLCEMEAGRRRVSAAQLFSIARHFDVPVYTFFDQRGDTA
jgi:transcriptional regulator with XRE-family HTH domain